MLLQTQKVVLSRIKLSSVIRLNGGYFHSDVNSGSSTNSSPIKPNLDRSRIQKWKPPGLSSHPMSTSSFHVDSIERLKKDYGGRFIHCKTGLINYTDIDIYLCGTLHVAKSSVDFVQDTIQTIKPDFVVLEICDSRIDSIITSTDDDNEINITLKDVFQVGIEERSLKAFGMGVMTWIQKKAAKSLGSKLGGELAMATYEAHKHGSSVVLGDRSYAVTVQRAFDRLSFLERIKMVIILFSEIIMMSFFNLKDYIKKTEMDEAFIKREIAKFGRWLPGFADVIINERDEYLAQTLVEIVKTGFYKERSNNGLGPLPPGRRGKVVAVVGAGHLPGIVKHLNVGGVDNARLLEISCSSKHQQSCWPGNGRFQTVRTEQIFSDKKAIN